ncbi:MAG TPA: glycoside hydrolase family 3 C-terminal domain-containing protein, partial [Myxococcaceae bacterium]|nr:glycoside hydrolase family 3 C-terminal domain-containing protein [Myxococcaceae bacterium]
LEMESISRRYGVGRAAVMAVKAGADMVLTPWSERKKAEVYAALLEAVRSGELSHARVEESVRRILTVKLRRGLFDAPRPDEERLAELSKPRRRDVAARIARESVTLVRADSRFFPLAAGKRLGVITAEPALAQAISARSPGAHVLLVPRYPKPEQRARLLERAREVARNSDLVVVGVFNSRQLELVRAAASSGKPVTVVSMGLPYLVEQVPEAKAVLALYSFRRSSAEAGVAALFGEQGTPGKLPVSLKQFPFGHGLNPVGEAMLSESTRQRDRTALP